MASSTQLSALPASATGLVPGIGLWNGLIAKWPLFLLGLQVLSGILVTLALAFLHWQTVEAGRRLTEIYGLVVAEETTRTVQTIDQRLEITALRLSHFDEVTTKNAASVNAEFKSQIKNLPYLRAMWFLDARGKVQYDSDPLNTVSDEGLPGGDIDYVDLFTAQPERDFYIGVPARGGLQGAWLIHAARPLRSSTGAITGVLVAAIDPHYFEMLWRKIDLGTDGSIALLSREGVVLIRSPFVSSVMGKSFKDRPVFKSLIHAQDHGNYVDVSSVDYTERIFSYHALAAQPGLVVIVGQSLAQVLAPWWRWVQLVLLVWVCAWLGIYGIARRLDREWQQRRASEALLRTSEARFRALFANAMDAIFLTAPDGAILSANPAACTMFDRTEDEIQALGRKGLLDTTDPRLPVAMEVRDRTGSFRGNLRCVRKGGELFSGEVCSSKFRDDLGNERTTIIIRDVTEQDQTQLALKQQAEQLQALSRRVMNAQETERRRLASELHDELGQSLTAIKINLQSGANFKDRTVEELNIENIRIVEDTLQQVRRLALALRPSILDNLGLVTALNWLGKQAAKRSHLQFEFRPIVLHDRLDQELETTCFRIAQEALTNIARHAKAKHFSISLTQEGDILVISIRDDGVGMDWPVVRAAAVGGGSFGMLGMVERAALVHGDLQVYSTVGQGCTLVLRCPVLAPLEMP